MQFIINSNIDYVNSIRSLANKHNVNAYQISKGTGISCNTVIRIFNGVSESTGKQYTPWVEIYDKIVRFFQEKTGEEITIIYPKLNTNSEQS